MGTLIVSNINLNDANVVNTLRSAIQRLINNTSLYYPLGFRPQFYFEIPNGSCPSDKGWYIILDGKMPVYAGKADDLNARLNTNNGSTDNFAKQNRTSDPERNFIKKFAQLNIISGLRVCVIKEKDLCSALNISSLTDLDRGNIEKLINIFRCYFNYH